MIQHSPSEHEWLDITEAKAICSCGAVKYKKHVKTIPEVVSIEEIWDGSKLLSIKFRVLYYLLYLTGARLNEALKLRRKDIKVHTISGKRVYLIRLITLKNKISPERYVPIIEDSSIVSYMIEEILEYISNINEENKLFRTYDRAVQRVFERIKFTTRAREGGTDNIIDEYTFKLWPHYLRHCRIEHLLNKYNLNDPAMVALMGWTDSRPLRMYGSRDWQSIAKKMMDSII